MIPTLEPLEARTLPSFLPATFYQASLQPYTVAVGDLNGDGRLDAVTADGYSHGGPVLVWLGNGDGTLRAPPTSLLFGSFQYGLALGDFNRDGRLDVAVTTGNHPDTGRGRGVHVLLGRGDGSFEPPRSLDPGDEPWFLARGDFNRDGQLDLAVSLLNSGGDLAGLRVLLGRGDGTFTVGPIHHL